VDELLLAALIEGFCSADVISFSSARPSVRARQSAARLDAYTAADQALNRCYKLDGLKPSKCKTSVLARVHPGFAVAFSTPIIGKTPMPRCTLAALIESFCCAEVISFSAQFALRCRRSGALLAGTRLGLR
jgi:hypothetical protein